MASPGDVEVVRLRRYDTSTNWGFRMMGGREFQLPLFAVAIAPKGLAAKAGLRNGDAILAICGTNVQGWTNSDAKSEMMRAGNEVDLAVQRGAVDTKDPAIKAQAGVVAKGKQRVELDEESINPHMNEGSTFRNVTPKSYKILEQQLGTEEAPPAPAAPPRNMQPVHSTQASGKPSSIFDRKKQDRSDYLVAQGQTIQKTYGEQ